MSQPSSDKTSAPAAAGGYKDRPWIPRFWNGMGMTAFARLMVRNRMAIGPRRLGMAAICVGTGLCNAALWAMQSVRCGRKIADTAIQDDPIFVLGHWRSGTTLLHELLVLDPRHTYPETYDCFAPNHFLISSWFVRPMLSILLPARRPQDNMIAGWDRPQEDEFALCNMGAHSPYLTIAFPNRPPQDQEYLDFQGATAEAKEHWKRQLLWFLKCLTVRSPKRIVLKSPAHTARVRVLLELFPKARFVHIIRDPFVIFPSTVNLWKRLYRDQGFQYPRFKGLDTHVFETFNRMYEAFHRDRPLIPPGQFSEVRYEDLTADPIGQMRKVYDDLGLDGFDRVLPGLEQYVAKQAGYKTNRYPMTPETRAEIARHWGWFAEQYGYASAPVQAGEGP